VKFLLDHDAPDEVARLLRHWGYEVDKLRSVLPVTARDDEIFQFAQARDLVIISCNRDHFLALAQAAVAKQETFAGLVILIRRRTRQSECGHLLRLLRNAGEPGLCGNINFA
jgi:predicted nuclease of predicted toxin-antitoxin system